MYQLAFYVPESHLDSVKDAVFSAGAGTLGHYAKCAWQTLGQGQFQPLTGSDPYLGQQDTLTQVAEYKVEMLCPSDALAEIITALKKAHPYEEPAYQVIALVDV